MNQVNFFEPDLELHRPLHDEPRGPAFSDGILTALAQAIQVRIYYRQVIQVIEVIYIF